MAYESGGLIEAADFNSLREQLLDVYGTGTGVWGYGQTAINVPAITGGYTQPVRAVEWLALRNAIEVCGNHQGSNVSGPLPAVSALQAGQQVIAYPDDPVSKSFPLALYRIRENKHRVADSSLTTFYNRVDQSRQGSWSTKSQTIFQVNFNNEDQARWFFNSGGTLRFRFQRTGGSARDHNTIWSNMLDNIGLVDFTYNSTIANNAGDGSNIGYYNLLENENTRIYTNVRGVGPYGDNEVSIDAQARNVSGVNGGNGRSIRFKVVFSDNYENDYDNVNGTLKVKMHELRATTHLNIETFDINIVTPLEGF